MLKLDLAVDFVQSRGQDVLTGVGVVAASATWIAEVDHVMRIVASIAAIVASYFAVRSHVMKQRSK